MRIKHLMFLLGILELGWMTGCGQQEPDHLIVFAAASATNALNEIVEEFTEQTGIAVVSSFAGSSTLAKQIEQGAPAHVFLSANPVWMDYLEARNRIVPESRVDLLHNRLVAVAAKYSETNGLSVNPGSDLLQMVAQERLALGDPDHIPAGIYAKKCLQHLKVWDGIEPRVARAMDVRAALALVERQEAPVGIVYSTDAAISKKVKIIGMFPEECHGPITYPLARVSTNQHPGAESFVTFLSSATAIAIFEKYGFIVR